MRTTYRALTIAVGVLLTDSAFATVQQNGSLLNAIAVTPDGKQMNGKQMNGKQMNGTSLNGVQLNGAVLNGKQMNGTVIAGLQLSGTMLQGTLVDSPMCAHSEAATGDPLPSSCNVCAGIVCNNDAHCCSTSWDSTCVSEAQSMCAVNAKQLVNNGTLQATMLNNDGTTVSVALRINAMRRPDYWTDVQTCTKTRTGVYNCTDNWVNRPDLGPNADVNIYDVSYNDPAYGWLPLCTNTDADGHANSAIPVGGAWETRVGTFSAMVNGFRVSYGGGGKIPGTDATTFTFGCRNFGAIAKCVEDGYKPWTTGTAHDQNGNPVTLSLADAHQACVRMIRADYCGDGQSHTVDGTAIDIADRYSIQLPDPSDTKYGMNYGAEAEWNAGGAVCISNPRYQSSDPNPYPPGMLPPTPSSSPTVLDYVNAHCPQLATFGATYCMLSWPSYNAGSGFSEPSFVYNGGPYMSTMLDYSSTVVGN